MFFSVECEMVRNSTNWIICLMDHMVFMLLDFCDGCYCESDVIHGNIGDQES